MKVLIDTSIWSLVLRRKTGSTSIINNAEKNELKELINESRVAIIGPIRQEILSGISNDKQFKILKEKLQAFEDIAIQQL
ncbi:MAG: PIN domain nuclease, partial [Spirochaetota bacterium]|nr:PIN domain nuclease [Spirochaetota bacterium]